MSPLFAGCFADAAALWRRDRDLLVRIAAALIFLPAFGLELLIPTGRSEAATLAEAVRAQIDLYAANAPWLLLAGCVTLFGEATLYALLLDRERPTVAEAMRRAMALFLPYFLVQMVAGLVVALGVLLIVPGFYAIGRFFMLGAVVMGEGERNPGRAFARAVALSRGHGWLLFAVGATVYVPLWLVSSLVGNVERSLGPAGGNPVTGAILAAIVAAATAAVALATLLLRVAAYRRLSESSRGT